MLSIPYPYLASIDPKDNILHYQNSLELSELFQMSDGFCVVDAGRIGSDSF